MTTTLLHATPYNLDAAGFYFTNADDYEAKSSTNFDNYGILVEEWEIQYIDGDDVELFASCGINQTNLDKWYEIEQLEDHEKTSLFYLLTNGYELTQALEKIDEPCITQSDLKDAAAELFDEIYLNSIPEVIRYYIDYEKFARDCEIGGDLTEFKYAGTTYTCTNASGM